MVLKPFTIYRSSAGSGKTRTLAREYLTWALKNKAHYFRHILAVTFTNKATQEMKDRILAYLGAFTGKMPATKDSEELALELRKTLSLDEVTFRQNCNELLTLILHQYDQFSISTIDAFFQRVIRSFTREAGLLGDYRLEVEQEAVLTEVVNDLFDELAENGELTRWVVRFAQENMESDKTWDIRRELARFSKEIFRDEFKLIEEEVNERASRPQFFNKLHAAVSKVRNEFVAKVSVPAREILGILKQKGWTAEHFKFGTNSGLMRYLRLFAFADDLKDLEIRDRIREEFVHAGNWPGKKYPLLTGEILALAEQEFVPRVRLINETFDKEYGKALTADLVLKNFYVFGLIADITRKLRDYKRENNLMLLADAPKFLNRIIGESDTPFVYEKVGSFYRNYLIDEFQDTSGFQWKNFLPLVTNSLDQGYPSLVVGDVKQAIYRWRGGDLSLLQKQVEAHISKERVDVKELDSNYRSAPEIVEFNNQIFASAALQAGTKLGVALPGEVYHDVRQKSPVKGKGYVQVDFLAEDKEDKWATLSLEKIPRDLEMLQQQGVQAGEIAILVRRNEEGQRIAAHLLEYKHSANAKKDVVYEVVSNESLRIDGAGSVNLLLSALRHLVNPDDRIAQAQLCYEFARLRGQAVSSDIFNESSKVFFESKVPESFTKHKLSLKKLPLFELTETLIGLFGLGNQTGELAYLQAFQDLVLDFYTRERNDLAAFLDWWEENKSNDKTSIKLSGEVNAVNIITIHKAKGLQFPYVLIPFCSWSVDHEGFLSPLLWVTSEKEPYADAGPMPVKYSKAVGNSWFQESYAEEKVKVYLDNLNVLYVALTRAERGMIITGPPPKTKTHNTSVAAWMYNAIQQNPELQSNWNNGAMQWKVGNLEGKKETKPVNQNPLKLERYNTSQWREKLVIRQTGNPFFEGMNPETRESIRYGVYLHALMSRIHTRDDVPKVLLRLIQEGLITQEEKATLESQLTELLSNPVVSKWFAEDWDVRTEVPILLPGGNTQRIDRLMLKGKQAVIVDFKTGEPSKGDHDQVTTYIGILKEMGFAPVEGYLFYTRDKEVVPVDGNKPKPGKRKKNDGQMDLGL